MDYQNGKIYKLISNQTNKVYVGSTCTPRLSTRIAGHRNSYIKWKNNKGRYVTSFELLKYDDCKIVLIENFPCQTKDELRAKEQHWITKTKNTVNKRRAHRTKKDISEDAKIRRKKNPEHFKEKDARKYAKHRENILQARKEYYLKNKAKIQARESQKFVCDCGGKYIKHHKSTHYKTNKHIEWSKNNSE